jgi:L-asparaginase
MSVVLLTTGGTIASTATGSDGVVATIDGAALLAGAVADAPVGVEVVDLLRANSYALGLEQIAEIARAARDAAARPGVTGVVVTHGTDTLEETAYLTDLLHRGAAPIVFTGAQRAADHPFTDGPANLASALRLAADKDARELGVLVCFESRVDAARDAAKVHTSALRGFAAPGTGPVGELRADGLRVLRRPPRPPAPPGDALDPRVPLVRLAAGDDGSLIAAACAAGARGLVVEAFGLGNATPAVLDAVRHAVEHGVLVAICSRCSAGGTRPLYGAGGGADLAVAGALFAGDLAGPKARLLLMLALGAGCDRAAAAALLGTA